MKKQATKNQIEQKNVRTSEVQNILNQNHLPYAKSKKTLFSPPSPEPPRVGTPIPPRKISNGPRMK